MVVQWWTERGWGGYEYPLPLLCKSMYVVLPKNMTTKWLKYLGDSGGKNPLSKKNIMVPPLIYTGPKH